MEEEWWTLTVVPLGLTLKRVFGRDQAVVSNSRPSVQSAEPPLSARDWGRCSSRFCSQPAGASASPRRHRRLLYKELSIGHGTASYLVLSALQPAYEAGALQALKDCSGQPGGPSTIQSKPVEPAEREPHLATLPAMPLMLARRPYSLGPR